jgi:hypothetical protein
MRKTHSSAVSVSLLFLLTSILVFIVQPVNAQQSNTSFTDNFSDDSGAWQYMGSAQRDAANKYMVLTNQSSDQTGIAFLKTAIKGSFTANFRFLCTGYTYDDGLVMFFYKQQYPSNLEFSGSYGANGIAGGRTGFNTGSIIPGYGVEFDGWQNIQYEFAEIVGGKPNPNQDPSAHHVALIKDFTGDHLTWADSTNIAPNVWHDVSVQVQSSSVEVYIDQKLFLQWNGTIDRTYDGFGFSGSNGMVACSTHIIDDFSISAKDLHIPTLTTTCESVLSESSLKVKINGDLTFNGAGIPNAAVLLSYSVTNGESWQDLTALHTGSDGSYSALWFPAATGDYMLKAVYQGDENYLGASKILNFSIVPGTEQSVFSVTSNSTLSAFSFDFTNKELSFQVSGDNATTGYVNVYVPKSLMNDISGLTVHLDNSQIDFNAQPQGDGWMLYFTYHHSSHMVKISLNSSSSQTSSTPLLTFGIAETVILVVMGIILAVVAVVTFVSLSRKSKK